MGRTLVLMVVVLMWRKIAWLASCKQLDAAVSVVAALATAKDSHVISSSSTPPDYEHLTLLREILLVFMRVEIMYLS